MDQDAEEEPDDGGGGAALPGDVDPGDTL